MARVAVVIANSVTAQPTQRGIGRSRTERAANQLGELFSGLPDDYRFDVRTLTDKRGQRVNREIDQAAAACSEEGSLLLVYYFGHGVRQADGLAFVHPGNSDSHHDIVPFSGLFYRIRANNPANVLFLLDCCYAGAAGAQVVNLPENRYCLIACTDASTRALWENRGDTPIGFFTSALLDAFSNPGAAVSATDDHITVASLFRFVRDETSASTDNAQIPYMIGQLDQRLGEYSEKPTIVPGITEKISLKSAYSKLHLIVKVLGRRNFPDLRSLYRSLLDADRRVFLTNFREPDGRIAQKPAHWTVVRRYISFLRAIHVVDYEELRLTPRGIELLEDAEDEYNLKLLRLIDRYLRAVALDRDELKRTMQRVIQRRWLPTRANVLGDLVLRKRGLNEQHVTMVLDLLGYIGAIGTLRRREQVYFPWGASQAQPVRE